VSGILVNLWLISKSSSLEGVSGVLVKKIGRELVRVFFLFDVDGARTSPPNLVGLFFRRLVAVNTGDMGEGERSVVLMERLSGKRSKAVWISSAARTCSMKSNVIGWKTAAGRLSTRKVMPLG
jgi:hypothetical protein